MVLTFIITLVLGMLVGRYCNVLGLVLTSIVVLATSIAVFFNMHSGVAFWLIAGLNLTIYEITTVSSMLFHATPPRQGARALLAGLMKCTATDREAPAVHCRRIVKAPSPKRQMP